MSKVEILEDEAGRLSLYIDDTRVSPRSTKPRGQPKVMAKWSIPVMEVKPCPKCAIARYNTGYSGACCAQEHCKNGWVLA